MNNILTALSEKCRVKMSELKKEKYGLERLAQKMSSKRKFVET
jgi:hypothetical protein